MSIQKGFAWVLVNAWGLEIFGFWLWRSRISMQAFWSSSRNTQVLQFERWSWTSQKMSKESSNQWVLVHFASVHFLLEIPSQDSSDSRHIKSYTAIIYNPICLKSQVAVWLVRFFRSAIGHKGSAPSKKSPSVACSKACHGWSAAGLRSQVNRNSAENLSS